MPIPIKTAEEIQQILASDHVVPVTANIPAGSPVDPQPAQTTVSMPGAEPIPAAPVASIDVKTVETPDGPELSLFAHQIEDWTGQTAIKEMTTFGVKVIAAMAAAPVLAKYLPMVGITLSPDAAQQGLPVVIGIVLKFLHDLIKKKYKVTWL